MPNFNKELHVNQVFKSIQGEGPEVGTPSLFIRMQYCNLCCDYCDTKYALRDDEHTIIATEEDFDDFFEKVEMASEGISNLVLTGGEPLLYAKNSMLLELIESGIWSNIEIETNGMLITEGNVRNLVNHTYGNICLNISPKLDDFCYKTDIDLDYIIKQFKRKSTLLWQNYRHIGYIWKFVHDRENGNDILKFVDKVLNNSTHNVWVMPWTPSRNSPSFGSYFRQFCDATMEFCMENGFRYSPREHVWLFDPSDVNEMEKVL